MKIALTSYLIYVDEAILASRPVGGIQNSAYHLYRGLQNRGWNIRLLYEPEGGPYDAIIFTQIYNPACEAILKPGGKRILWNHLNACQGGDAPHWNGIVYLTATQKEFLSSKWAKRYPVLAGVPQFVVPPPYWRKRFEGLPRAKYENRRLIFAGFPKKGVIQLYEMRHELNELCQAYGATLDILTGGIIHGITAGALKLPDFGDVPHINLLPPVPLPDLLRELSKSSVFLYPSHVDEGCPLTVIYALVLGLPVITTDYLGLGEIAQGQFLIKPDTFAQNTIVPQMSERYKVQFLEATEQLLRDQTTWEIYHNRALNSPIVQKAELDAVVAEWEKILCLT